MDMSEAVDTKKLARRIRLHVLKMIRDGGSSHIGSIFSAADILAVLYGSILNVRSDDPTWTLRDRFVLSKGHAGAGVYATLAEVGFFDISLLEDYYQDGSDMWGHLSHIGIPGVEVSTGSLGHGLSLGVGMAKAGKLNQHSYRVFVLLSDGECDAGSTWEAAMFSAHHQLDNLTAIVDYNKIQSLGSVSETLELEPFADKWRSFGWEVREVDGHDHDNIKNACFSLPLAKGRPSCIIAHTTKGKGVSFMENSVLWHYRTATGDEYSRAVAELDEQS